VSLYRALLSQDYGIVGVVALMVALLAVQIVAVWGWASSRDSDRLNNWFGDTLQRRSTIMKRRIAVFLP